jgi:Secretion system C-terminal sorting domain/Reeler domain
MKKKVVLLSMVAGIAAVTLSSYHAGPAANGYDCTGAESAATGSFANQTGCYGGGCHGGSSSTGSSTVAVAIELDSAGGVATTHYKGGMTYTVKITGTNTGTTTPYYGFQLAALKDSVSRSTNSDAGTWASTGLPASTHIAAPGTYTQLNVPEQSAAIAISGTTFTQSFSWTAPATGTGTISFWGAANFTVSSGGHSNSSSDRWNTNHIIIHEWTSTTAVANVENNIEVVAFPNPVVNTLNFQLGNANGACTITVTDLSGKTVAQENVAAANQTVSINTNGWNKGLYMVTVSNNGNNKTVTVSKN